MGQIVAWSARDESLHTESIIRLYHTFLHENPEVDTEEHARDLYKICDTIITLEDAFIDLAFGVGGIEGLTPEDVKRYIRFIGDRRLSQLALTPMYKIETNPLPWMDEILNGVEHTNFFENRVTEYSKAATSGTWDEAFA
jgi:ribonucleoside-diphosphate reductase beta chain